MLNQKNVIIEKKYTAESTTHALLFSPQGSLSILCAIPRALESLHDSTAKWGNANDRYVRCDISFGCPRDSLAGGLRDVRSRFIFKKNAETPHASQGRVRMDRFRLLFPFFLSGNARIRFHQSALNSNKSLDSFLEDIMCHQWVFNFVFKSQITKIIFKSSLIYFLKIIYTVVFDKFINIREYINSEGCIWIQSKHILFCARQRKFSVSIACIWKAYISAFSGDTKVLNNFLLWNTTFCVFIYTSVKRFFFLS